MSSSSRTSGNARRNSGRRGTSCWRAKATGAVTRSRPRGAVARSRTLSKPWAIWAKAPRVSSASRSPASVSRMLRVVRRTSGTPAARSSSAMRWLIAALLTPSRAAAAVKLPCSRRMLSQCRWVQRVSIFWVSMQALFTRANNQFNPPG